MPTRRLIRTLRFRRGRLPHWEVEGGRYFITARLADSLPREVVLRLQEIHLTLQKIIPKSSQFYALQRQHFLTMEKYLDAGSGSCLLRNRSAAELVVRELTGLSEWLADVPHYSIMPNHWHAILVPQPGCQHSLTEMMKRVKGRSGRSLRQMDHTQGPIWQREWFDRWLRDDSEYDKTVRYIHENPVKAGLVSRWEDHPWTH